MENIDNLAVDNLEEAPQQNITEDNKDNNENNDNNNHPNNVKKKVKFKLTKKRITIGIIAIVAALALVVALIIISGSGPASFYNNYKVNYPTLSADKLTDKGIDNVNSYDNYGNAIVYNDNNQVAVYNFVSQKYLINWQEENIHCLFDGMFAIYDSTTTSLYDIYYDGGMMDNVPAERVLTGSKYVLNSEGNMVYINPHNGELVTVSVTDGITPNNLAKALVLDKYYVIQEGNTITYYGKDYRHVATHDSECYSVTAASNIETFVLSNGNAVFQNICTMPDDTASRDYDYSHNNTKYKVNTFIYNVSTNKVTSKNVNFIIVESVASDVVNKYVPVGQITAQNFTAVKFFDNKLLKNGVVLVGLNNGLSITADLNNLSKSDWGRVELVGEGLYAIINNSGDTSIYNSFGGKLHTFVNVGGTETMLYNRGVIIGDSLYSFEGKLIKMYEDIEVVCATSFIYTVDTESNGGYVTNYYISTGKGEDKKIDGYNEYSSGYYSTVNFSSNTYTIKLYSIIDNSLLVDYTSSTSGDIREVDSVTLGDNEYILLKVGNEAYFRINVISNR